MATAAWPAVGQGSAGADPRTKEKECRSVGSVGCANGRLTRCAASRPLDNGEDTIRPASDHLILRRFRRRLACRGRSTPMGAGILGLPGSAAIASSVVGPARALNDPPSSAVIGSIWGFCSSASSHYSRRSLLLVTGNRPRQSLNAGAGETCHPAPEDSNRTQALRCTVILS